MGELPHRARTILCAVVTEFIATGEPTGSRTLVQKYGLDLSSASIRNVLADLEDSGFLLQPHTSAGRIPTDKAFRLFLDTLMETRAPTAETRATITERFEAMAPGADLLRASGRLLSELAGTAALVVRARGDARTLRHLRFLSTRPGEMLAVLVFADGSVENRFVRLDRPLAEPELGRIHNLLAEVIDDRSLDDLRALFVRRLADDTLALDSLRHRAFSLGQQAVGTEPTAPGVVIEGHARLLEHPDFSDVERLRQLALVLGDRQSLVELLERTSEARGVQVLVGSEAGEFGAASLSVVAAPYTEQGRVAGSIGVLGPTRMDYPTLVPLVQATATAMSAVLEERSRGDGDG